MPLSITCFHVTILKNQTIEFWCANDRIFFVASLNVIIVVDSVGIHIWHAMPDANSKRV